MRDLTHVPWVGSVPHRSYAQHIITPDTSRFDLL